MSIEYAFYIYLAGVGILALSAITAIKSGTFFDEIGSGFRDVHGEEAEAFAIIAVLALWPVVLVYSLLIHATGRR